MDERIVPFDRPPAIETPQGPRKVKIFGLFALILALALGAGAFAFITVSNKGDIEDRNPKTQKERFLADRTVIYGYWTAETSVIESLDLSNGRTSVLSILPSNIKHVKIPFPNLVYFISETNLSDYGTKIIQKNLSDNTEKTIISADSGFGIDDYRISPNGNYIAVWMVELPSDSPQLQNGKSRVYSIDVNTLEKNLIYDEISNSKTPVNYPLGITDSGQIFTDKFLPNSGAGWAYGMTVTDINGQTKQEISNMGNGTYGTQPVISGDGSYFAFAGYNGDDGASIENNFRKALISPNTFEVLNTNSLERTVVNTGIENAIYSGVMWDSLSNSFIVSAIHRNGNSSVVNSQLSYNPVTQTVVMLNIPPFDENDANNVIGIIDSEKYLVVDKVNGQSNLGNLGKSYAQVLNNISIYNSRSQTTSSVGINQQPFQLIDVKNGGYFSSLLESSNLSYSSDQLQLQTFVIKPTLAPVRERQQSERPVVPNEPPPSEPPIECREIGYPQCNNLLGTNYPVDKDIGDIGDSAFSECIWAKQAAGEASGICSDSPLYIYGDKGTRVTVEVGAKISRPNVNILNNTFDAVLDGDGNLNVNSKNVSSIEFDYISKVKRLPILYSGYLVSKDKLKEKLTEISSKFRFNEKETNDILKFAPKIDSPYVFISFYDGKISHQILPLYFSPMPDIYRNIVFYFEKLEEKPAQSINPPIIDPIERRGFTAIEISYIVR